MLKTYGRWDLLVVWAVLLGLFIVFIPFNRKSQKCPASVYIAFVTALAFKMFGIPLSLYIMTWVVGLTLPEGILWDHTLQQYVRYWGMYKIRDEPSWSSLRNPRMEIDPQTLLEQRRGERKAGYGRISTHTSAICNTLASFCSHWGCSFTGQLSPC